MKTNTLKTAAILACLAATVTPAQAQEATTDGIYMAGAERIEAGDRIRMMSQRITAVSCLIDAGIDVDRSRETIAAGIAEVDAILLGMRDGDASLGLEQPEDDRKMLVALRRVGLQWDNFRMAAQLNLADGAETNGPDYVSRQNLNLMHASKYLINETISHYAIPPVLLQSDAFTLQIVARQRTLSQQIAKEACGIITDNTVMGNQKRFDKSVARFEASYNALMSGFAPAGVSPPPTPEIEAALGDLSASWAAAKADLDQVSATANDDLAMKVYDAMSSVMTKFDALVDLYVADSKASI